MKRHRLIAAEEVIERQLSAEMRMFYVIEKKNPQLAERMRNDFEEAQRVTREVFKELSGEDRHSDIVARLPNNMWLMFLEAVGFAAAMTSPGIHFTEADRREFREAVRKRMKGKHLQ